jgi:hypothetical protein
MPMQNLVCKAVMSECLISTNVLKMTFGPVYWLFFDGSKRAECRSTHRP